MRFSANLGFLWNEIWLPDAIRAAKRAGFDAVECHWPYDIAARDVRKALSETGLTMLGLNTRRCNVDIGEMGLAAVPGRVQEACLHADEALAYARDIGARMVHVIAGNADGQEAEDTFVHTLLRVGQKAAKHDQMILIEPLNAYDAPGYFLKTTPQAVKILRRVGLTNVRLMFDCYHVGRTEGDVETRLQDVFAYIGHIQFAAVPDRGEPLHGTFDFLRFIKRLEGLGWDAPLGAEYKPVASTEESLGWLKSLRAK